MTTQELVERLRAIDRYLTSLWDHAALLRANHSGQAHADLNDLRHGIGAIPDGLAEAASRLSEMEAENKRLEKERAYAVHQGRGVKSVKEVMWRYEDALKRIAALPRYTDGDNEAQEIARAALEPQQKETP